MFTHCTLAGGTVKYVGITWIACPDAPEAVGECMRAGTLEVWSHGRITETFGLRAGDRLLVADGIAVGAGTALAEPADWQRTLRADLPPDAEAIVAWSEPPHRVCHDGVQDRPRFAPGWSPVRLVLHGGDGHVLAAHDLDRSVSPIAATGAVVRRGDPLASIPAAFRDNRIGGIARLIAFLNARPGRHRAVVAPCNGTIEALEPGAATLRARDGRVLRLRLPRPRHLAVEVGDEVFAGEPILHGERSHHALLHAWGEARLAEHMIAELEIETTRRGLAIPRVYWALVVRAMLRWRLVQDPGDTALRTGDVVSRAELDRAQADARTRGQRTATAVPVLRSIGFRRIPSAVRPRTA